MQGTTYCKNLRLYHCWSNMKSRCNNPDKREAKYYHNKGITYCEEWETYRNFEEWALNNGYSDNLTLDRIDNSKGYNPSNCRWITAAEQQRNKTNNLFFTHNGKTKTLTEWARDTGIDRTTLHDRIFKFGYTFEQALKKDRSKPRNSVLLTYKGQMVSQGELAKLLGVTKTSVSRWRKRGYTVKEMVKKAEKRGDIKV